MKKDKSSPTANLHLLIKSIGEERFKLDESLEEHTFTRSEGTAECLYIATNKRELIKALECCYDLKIPVFVIGSGTKVLLSARVKGLVIKNRTSTLKIAGMKGKISKDGLGIEEAFVEAESGVSLNKLNEFIKGQKLMEIDGFSSLNATVGGAIFIDPLLRKATQSLRIWEDGEETEIKLEELRRDQIVLSVIFKFKAKEK